MKYKIFLVLTIISFNVFAQNKSGISQKDFKSKIDSLQNLKRKLLAQKETLEKEIEKLRDDSAEMDAKLRTALRKVYRRRYGRKIGDRILDKQIWKGMTERMLRDSWGKPDRITRNKEKWGLFTQWYYGKITFFFKDRKLVDWEEKK